MVKLIKKLRDIHKNKKKSQGRRNGVLQESVDPDQDLKKLRPMKKN